MGCTPILRQCSTRRQENDWRVHRFTRNAGEWLARPIPPAQSQGLSIKRDYSVDAIEQVIMDSARLLGDGTERDWDEAQPSLPVARDRAIEFLRLHANQARR